MSKHNKHVKSNASALHCHYNEYNRSYRNGYIIVIKETPVTIADGQQGNSDEQQNDEDQYADEDANNVIEEQKQRLRVANVSFDAGLHSEAFQEYEALANEGMGIAQFYTGYAYHKSLGVEKIFPHAFKWYRLAGDKNIPQAAYQLAKIYYYGEGSIAPDFQTAAYWAQRSTQAFNNAPYHKDELGVKYLYAKMLENGHGVPANLKKALSLYQFVRPKDRHHLQINGDIALVKKYIREDRLNSFRRF